MSSNITVNVFIPHLFDSLSEWHNSFFFVPETDLLVPLLNQFSARRVIQTGFIESLYTITGFAHSLELSEQIPPHAIACYYYDFGKMPTEAVLLATPIHLQTGMTDVSVDGLAVNDISAVEAEALQTMVNRHFQSDGLRLEQSPSGRWYVLLPFALMPEQTYAVDRVLGNSLFPFLHHTKQLEWNRLLNELQMLLYTATVNQQRENNGLRSVSSFWLWGNAQCNNGINTIRALQQGSQSVVQHVVAGGFYGQAIAHMLEATWHPSLPELDVINSGNNDKNENSGNMMLIVDELVQPALSNDMEQWQKALTAIDSDYIKPLMKYYLVDHNIELIFNSCDGRQWLKRRWYQRLLPTKKKTLLDYSLN